MPSRLIKIMIIVVTRIMKIISSIRLIPSTGALCRPQTPPDENHYSQSYELSEYNFIASR